MCAVQLGAGEHLEAPLKVHARDSAHAAQVASAQARQRAFRTAYESAIAIGRENIRSRTANDAKEFRMLF